MEKCPPHFLIRILVPSTRVFQCPKKSLIANLVSVASQQFADERVHGLIIGITIYVCARPCRPPSTKYFLQVRIDPRVWRFKSLPFDALSDRKTSTASPRLQVHLPVVTLALAIAKTQTINSKL